jgi:hypothetical protein
MNCSYENFDWLKYMDEINSKIGMIIINYYIDIIFMSNFLWKKMLKVKLQEVTIYNVKMCCNPSLGFMTKARACKGVGQEWSTGVTFHVPENAKECEGMNPTFSSELPFWELESQWTLKSSEGDCRDQNSLDWEVLYIIKKFLECRCLKWVHMTHLGA